MLPEVLRVVLTRILIIDKFDSQEDTTDWQSLWLDLCKKLPGIQGVPTSEFGDADELANAVEMELWIDEAVRSFVRKLHIEKRFSDWWHDQEVQ